MNCASGSSIKERHSLADFFYYKLLTSVPLFTVLVGLWRTEPAAIIFYLLWIALHMGLVYRLLCSHCPHYGAYNGKTQCLYLWGIPAIYHKRPESQAAWERIGVLLLLAVSILFPVYWLVQVWELLVIYLLFVAVLLMTMMRYECSRCAHTDCAHNTASRSA